MKAMIKATLLVLLLTGNVIAQNMSAEENVKKTLNDFETAIIENDIETATKLLSSDAIILEGKGMETKEEYLSHHFEADGKFLKSLNRKVLSREISIEGNTAWVSSVSSLNGTYSENEIDLTSLELAVLKNEGTDWKVAAIHWSSR